MLNNKQNILVLSVMAALLSACGGGGGDSSSSTTSGNQVATTLNPPQKAAVTGDLSCQAGVCALPASANADAVGKVYQLQNNTGQDMQITVNGPLTARWDAVMTQVDSDPLGYGGSSGAARGNNAAAEAVLEQKMQQFYAHAASYGAVASRAQARMRLEKRVQIAARSYALNDSRSWYDSIGSRALNATMKASQALPNGGTVYVWAQNDAAAVTQQQAAFLAERFANSVFPIEAAVISEPWGPVHSTWQGITLDAGTKDVHLVLAQLNQPANAFQGLLGYAYPLNAILKSAASDPTCGSDCSEFANSNEALVTFLNVDTLVAADDGQSWSPSGKGPALTLSTLGHEYQHLLYSYNKLFRRMVGSPRTTTWENELAAQTMGYLVAADTYGGGRGDSATSHPDLRSGGDFSQFLKQPACDLKRWSAMSGDSFGTTCYPKALATGMLMLHQYGAGVMKPWVTGANVGERALDDGLAAVGGGDYGSLMQQLYTSLALADFSTWPAGYGFPAKQLGLPASRYFPAGKTIALPQININPSEVQLSADSAQEAYRLTLAPVAGQVSITVPANSRLSLVKR
ncbi:hypothetical protein AWB61_17700 [Chromobacterium sp. F49]|nr:hypothetical protein [Chromobacterium subtsugae]KUM04453.1 hypothetical protein Cv017_14275 [Chromobacterium subtsugae]KZE86107.1 hypothetical protein AWB61_17700 [Chromobacterium sp. F49]OBU85069.1 hypothetical protein MY55_18890 [Chromobacterium subtsugae]